MTQQKLHHTATHLKTRLGWTEALMTQYLGQPDRKAPNPHRSDAPPMRLYLAERVDQARNQNPELRSALDRNIQQEQARNRDRNAERAMSDAQLLELANAMPIIVADLPSHDAQQLVQTALQARDLYVNEQYQLEAFRRLDPDSLEARRQAVHLVRHHYTNYDTLLIQMPQVGRAVDRDIYNSIRDRTLQTIADQVPGLSDACQAILREMEQPQDNDDAPKFIAMDIETVKPFPEGEDWHDHRPLGIACVAITGLQGPIAWFGGDPNGLPAERMTTHELSALIDHLQRMTANGYTIVTWNGMGFDWPILAEESGRLPECQHLARRHIDMMYHFLCEKGYPLGLAAAAAGMGVGNKTEGITGSNAPEMWAKGQRKEVIEYCCQDAALTLDLAISCNINRRLSWTSRSGRPNHLLLPEGWKTVKDAALIPPPDTSWMTNPIQRSQFDHWLDD